MAAIKDLKPCPKCQSMRIATIRSYDLYENKGNYVVHCWECGHTGPPAESGGQARDKWNEEVK